MFQPVLLSVSIDLSSMDFYLQVLSVGQNTAWINTIKTKVGISTIIVQDTVNLEQLNNKGY